MYFDVPLGTFWGLVEFNTFINDPDDRVKRMLIASTDDTKLG